MMNLNLKSTFLATRAALEHMPDGGRIVNMATTAVTSTAPGSPYVASKGGLTSLTGSLRNELKERRITANGILLTIEYTPANRRGMPSADRSSWLLPEEVADVILSLASDKGSIVTGNLIALEK